MTDQPPVPATPRVFVAGTDFSPAAATAQRWAEHLARARGAELHLVHALRIYGPPTDFLVSPPDYTEELQSRAVARLDEAVDRARAGGADARAAFRLGDPHRALLEAAEELGADLLVVGTRGSSGLEHFLLGSTAERVIERAGCPVLTVHPDQEPPAGPVAHLLVPTDFSDDAEMAVAAALELVAPGGRELRLTLLHAYYLPIEYTAYGTIPTSPRYLEDVAGAAEGRLKEVAERLARPGLTVETRATEGFPPEAVLTAARELGVDLIAMGTRGRTGLEHLLLGSTAERVVQRAPCPVLTVRRPRGD
ncbi:MAG: universal stress protein [Thermoanaerobaculia bacterium]|nr:universal stress protein [Thermoanaerobaculia bacterium]